MGGRRLVIFGWGEREREREREAVAGCGPRFLLVLGQFFCFSITTFSEEIFLLFFRFKFFTKFVFFHFSSNNIPVSVGFNINITTNIRTSSFGDILRNCGSFGLFYLCCNLFR